MAISHHLKMLSSLSVVNDSPMTFKNMSVLFTLARNYSASEELFDESIHKPAGDDKGVLFFSKIVVPVMIVRLGNILFVRQ
jgi:hypothetical protein